MKQWELQAFLETLLALPLTTLSQKKGITH